MAGLLGHIAASLLGVRAQPRWPSLPLLAASLILVMPAVGFLTLAAFLGLAESIGMTAAAMILGSILLLAAALLFFLAMRLRRPPPHELELEAMIMGLGDKAEHLLGGKTPAWTLGAGLLGLALGYSPDLRRLLKSLFEELI